MSFVLCILLLVINSFPVAAISNLDTSLTLFFQNNLNASDDPNHLGFFLLDPFYEKDAPAACNSLNETLLSRAAIEAHHDDVLHSLAYNAYAGRSNHTQAYYIKGGLLSVNTKMQILSVDSKMDLYPPPLGDMKLPVLCTQSSNGSQPGTSKATASNKITVASGTNTYVGYRNTKSFRFLGIPFADLAERWEYSREYTGSNKTIDATNYGAQCPQSSSGSEDCFYLNIQTPYIPKQGSKENLRPVMFWLYGGGYTSGTSADPGSDGGNLASREDIVVINVNYRLSTLGFLAIPGTNITGNYAIGDQITALNWTINNIAAFGGDPNQITITGGDAGAASVRVLLGSPQAIGKFQGAIAMSSLGGGVDLNLTGNYATTYSSYLTPNVSFEEAGQNLFRAAGCTQTHLNDQIACLRAMPALQVVGLPVVAHFVVQDGFIVNSQELNLNTNNGSTANVPVIFGNAADDGASFSNYPKNPASAPIETMQTALSISAQTAQSILSSGLFNVFNTGNITLDFFNVSQRIATDNHFRCVDQATVYAASQSGVFKASYYYQMQRTIAGFDPNNLGGPSVSPGFPRGNPNLPYFRLHSGDGPWMFGNLGALRDVNDLRSIQLTSGYFASFIKTGDPNPDPKYLIVRDYKSSIKAILKTGRWEEVDGMTGNQMKLLDYPSYSAGFQDVQQCAFLNYSLSYYVNGGT